MDGQLYGLVVMILWLVFRGLIALGIAIPIAVISWIVGKEELFRPGRQVCKRITEGEYAVWSLYKSIARDLPDDGLLRFFIATATLFITLVEAAFRKLCYIPTCEFCTSVWVSAWFYFEVFPDKYRFGSPGWPAFIINEFTWVAFANFYMSIYSRVRVEIHKDKAITEKVSGDGNTEGSNHLHGRRMPTEERDGVG